jgi:hypothetical protein
VLNVLHRLARDPVEAVGGRGGEWHTGRGEGASRPPAVAISSHAERVGAGRRDTGRRIGPR